MSPVIIYENILKPVIFIIYVMIFMNVQFFYSEGAFRGGGGRGTHMRRAPMAVRLCEPQCITSLSGCL